MTVHYYTGVEISALREDEKRSHEALLCSVGVVNQTNCEDFQIRSDPARFHNLHSFYRVCLKDESALERPYSEHVRYELLLRRSDYILNDKMDLAPHIQVHQ